MVSIYSASISSYVISTSMYGKGDYMMQFGGSTSCLAGIKCL